MHAYVLMTNHGASIGNATWCWRGVPHDAGIGRRYVRYINDSIGRTGTLWEGRYKASLVDDEHYVMTCYRYIELNPVRARMVAEPADYRRSSYRANGLGEHDPLVNPHELY